MLEGGGRRGVSLRFGEGQGAERHLPPLPVSVFAAPSLRLCIGDCLLVHLQRKGIVNAELGCHRGHRSEPGHLWLEAHCGIGMKKKNNNGAENIFLNFTFRSTPSGKDEHTPKAHIYVLADKNSSQRLSGWKCNRRCSAGIRCSSKIRCA